MAITPPSHARERTIDITTTTGARTGRPRRIEVWFYRVRADLQAVGTPVLDRTQREAVSSSIIADLNQPWNPAGIQQPVAPPDEWMQGSPLISVDFPEGDTE